MNGKLFAPKKLIKLNNPDRLKDIPPDYIWEKLNLNDPQIIIDYGAGTGFFGIQFAKYLTAGKVFAFDISDIMVDWMQANIVSEHPNVIPEKVDGVTIPLESESADLFITIALHHELDDPKTLLRDAHRVLRKGAKICIIDWKKEKMEGGPSNNIRISSEEIKTQLIEAGFEAISEDKALNKFNLLIGERGVV